MSLQDRSAASPTCRTLGDRVAERRRRLFVGRTAEIELFRAALHADDPPFSVLFLHGPGGIGKSRLLDRLAEYAEQAGVRVVRTDGGSLGTAPEGFAQVAAQIDVARATPPVEDGAAQRVVLVIDALGRSDALDGRIRDELIAALPDDGIAVVASRSTPGDGWNDLAWRERLRSVALRGLDAGESRELLLRSGLREHEVAEPAALAHGHPLALCLLAEIVRDRGPAAVRADGLLDADLVTVLLRRFLDTVPEARYRHALEVCALAWVTTEPLLRWVLEVEDAHDVFTWLRELSFVDAAPGGLRPHDLARDVLDGDLRWRSPEEYRRVFRRVRSYVHRSFDAPDPRQQWRALFDVKFIFRNLPGVSSPVDWASWGTLQPEPAVADDRAAICRLVEAFEGVESAELARHWLDRQPEAFIVLRDRGSALRGFLGLLDLTKATEADIAEDPVGRGRVATRHPGLAGARGRDRHPDPVRRRPRVSPGALADRERHCPWSRCGATCRCGRLAFDFLTLAEPDAWNDYFALAGLPRVAGADVVVGAHRFGLFCHDFRAVPVASMIESWEERALAQDFRRPAPGPPTPVVASKTEFANEVRQAMRDLRRPDLLARSALLRTRLVQERAAPDPPDGRCVARLLTTAAATLRDDPRDDKLWHAVRRTYLEPAGTQESAAASLGLPFSTYRRHLSRGMARIVDWCWEREVHGWPAPSVSSTEHR